MTKLMEWLIVLSMVFAAWYSLLTQRIANNFDPSCLFVFPVFIVALLGLYAATVVLYRTFTFRECKGAAEELFNEIQEGKDELSKLGFVFKAKTSKTS